jgi:hypothetical protein
MKLKFLKDAAYKQNEPSQSLEHKAGDVYEGSDDYCQRWIRRGVAVEVKAGKRAEPEAMVPAPPAKAHESIASVRKGTHH